MQLQLLSMHAMQYEQSGTQFLHNFQEKSIFSDVYLLTLILFI